MQAIINAVRKFLLHLQSWVLHLMCDNAKVVAYIKNKGGTRSYILMQLSMRLIKWWDLKAITLVLVHLPGISNIQADSLSRVGQTLVDRVDGGHGAFSAGVSQVEPGTGRPVCDLRQQTSAQLYVAVPQSQGTVHGCIVSSMDWDGSLVRIPAVQADSPSPAQSQSLRSVDNLDYSSVGNSFLVSHSSVRRLAATAFSRYTSGRRRGRDLSLPALKSICAEALRAMFVAKWHSPEAAKLMTRNIWGSSW